MAAERHTVSELLKAAEEFDSHLARFGRFAEAARTGPLNSQKNLERAARAFQQLGEAEKELGAAAQVLGAALSAARQLQEGQAQAVQVRAQEIERRTTIAAELIQRYGAIGEMAGDLNRYVLELAERETTRGSSPDSMLVAQLGEVRVGMAKVISDAGLLVAAAREVDFDDIARQVDSLRQQMVSADAKVATIEQSLNTRKT